MLRLLFCVFGVALTLSGCNRGNSTETGSSSGTPQGTDPKAKTPFSFTSQTGSLVPPAEVPLLEQINRENVRVLAATLPAVVRISATMPIDPHMQIFGNDLPFHFPHFGPGSSHILLAEPTYGSGIILSRDGYIVTNYHVIGAAHEIEVRLSDTRLFPARVVASDEGMDMAVLKIEAANLVALPWGDSDKVAAGEQVFAIGDPFDLQNSASRGIISAVGRTLPDPDPGLDGETYLQTDAAINPGNSGGALVNIHGELIGITTFIASYSRGNEGVGFAIPSNIARLAVEDLMRTQMHGYLGVRFPDEIDDGVISMLKLGNARGALLAGVIPKSPAETAGLRARDFVTEVDGHKINGVADFRLIVSQIPIGKEVAIRYIRDGTVQKTTVKIADIPKDLQTEINPDMDRNEAATVSPKSDETTEQNVLGGLQVSNLDDKSRQKFNVDAIVTAGVVVTAVQAGSLADAKGIQRSDVIESASVNHGSTQTLATAKDFSDLSAGLTSRQSVVLLVHRGKAPRFVFLAPQPQ